MPFRNDVVILFLIGLNEVYLKDCKPDVTVHQGPMTGIKNVTNNKTPFYAFLDIPYAVPPIGELRFKEPIPAGKWKGCLNAVENKKICIQFGKGDIGRGPKENEDCLVLNVYVPGNAFCQRDKSFLPVIFWIHGGSFTTGDGTLEQFGPHYFIDNNVIVVTTNYRLGPLGFLSTGDDVIPGNLALKDQLLALKWVSKNIESFGGDPKRVTLMGQSAGAISVGYHLMNQKNKGLFNAAIMQSISPLACASLQKYPKFIAYKVASSIDRKFGETNSTEELLALLQYASIDDIFKTSFLSVPDDKINCQHAGSLTWTITKEPKSAKNPVVTGMNYEKVKNGGTIKVPLLVGYNSQESLYYGTFSLPFVGILYDSNPANMINQNLNIKPNMKRATGSELKTIYTNSDFKFNTEATAEFISDSYFVTSIMTFGYFHSFHSDVYAYRFAFEGILGGQLNSSLPGVGHGADLNYLFQNSNNQDLSKFDEKEVIVHERLVALWSQFAKYRNPTKTTNDLLQNVRWPKFTDEKPFVLNINESLSVEKNPSNFLDWIDIVHKYALPKLDTY